MSKTIAKPAQTDTPQELLRDLFARLVLPDENQDDYDALRAVLLAELKPKSPYAELVADQLVELEWDLLRHRRLREELLRAEFRAQAEGAFRSGVVERLWGFDRTKASSDLARDLVSSAPKRRNRALKALAEREIPPGEIMAAAYKEVARDLEPHERQIAEIETRRRRLREDFDRVNTLPAEQIEEAQFVET